MSSRCRWCLVLLVLCAGVLPVVADAPTEVAQQHYNAGLQHKRDGNMEQARAELEAAIAECRDYAEAYWVLGWVQAELNDRPGACLSLNTFLGLASDDPRCQQAREAIERLGGTVAPTQPPTTSEPGAEPEPTPEAPETTTPAPTPGEAPATAKPPVAPPEADAPAATTLTREQAMALLSEAQQALAQMDYATAIEKGNKAAAILADDGLLHLTLALAYGGLQQWDQAFEHADRLVTIQDSADNRCYRILAVLAPDYPAMAQGFINDHQMNAMVSNGQLASEDLSAWALRAMQDATGGDGAAECAYLLGQALYEFMLFFGYYGEQNTQMMQLAHMNLTMALEDEDCPAGLQPEVSAWIRELTVLDFLRPQSEIEREAYDQETNWSEMIVSGRADSEQVGQWRRQRSAQYHADTRQFVQFATGTALASHDISWRYNGPNADQVAALYLGAAAQVMGNAIQEFPATDRARRIADFLTRVSPAEEQQVAQEPQQPPQQPMTGNVLQPQTQIEQYAYTLGLQLRQAQLAGRVSGDALTARIDAEMKRCQTLEALCEYLIGDSLAAFQFFHQMRSQEGVELAIQGVWQVLRAATPGSWHAVRANQVVNAMAGR